MFYSNENNLTFEDVIYDEIKKETFKLKLKPQITYYKLSQEKTKTFSLKLTIKVSIKVLMRDIKKDSTLVSMRVTEKVMMTTVSFKLLYKGGKNNERQDTYQ